jgi:hypothetical protein
LTRIPNCQSPSWEEIDASKMLMINSVQLIGLLRHAEILAELLIGEGDTRKVPTTDLVKREPGMHNCDRG